MNRKIIENQFNKYLQIYHSTEDDKLLLKNLKNCYHQEEVDLTLCSEDFLSFMLNESDLDVEIKTQIALKHQELIINFPKKKEVFEDSSITGIDRIFEFYNQHLKNKPYNFQIYFFGKIIPVKLSFEIVNASRLAPRHVLLQYEITLCGIFNEERNIKIFQKDIKNAKAKYKKCVFYDLMKEFTFPLSQISPLL